MRSRRLSWQDAREIRTLIRAAREFRINEGRSMFVHDATRRDIYSWWQMVPRLPACVWRRMH